MSAGPDAPPTFICWLCGHFKWFDSTYCPRCGALQLGHEPEAPASGASPSAGASNTPKRGPGRTVGIVFGVIVIVLLLLMLVPLPLPYSDTFQTNLLQPQAAPLGSSAGVSLSGSWSVVGGGSVLFVVVNSANATLYSAEGSSGSFSLSTSGGQLAAFAWSVLPETVDVSGTSWSPLIDVGLP